MNMEKQYQYSTIKRGKVKVVSQLQHRYLEAKKLPHTHIYKNKDGSVYHVRKYAK